jgi:hypothetical protein
VTVADPLHAETLKAVAVTAIQLVERGPVTSLKSLNQSSVPAEVHIIGSNRHRVPHSQSTLVP